MSDEEFIRLSEKYKDHIFRFGISCLGSREDSDDIVQETLLKLYLCKRKFETDEHVKNWLFKVALNEIRRSKRRENIRTIPLDEIEIADNTYGDKMNEVIEAVNSLAPKYRTVVHLFYYENCPVSVIAKITGRPQSTVRTQLQRAREMLKDKLNGVEINGF